jgi:uncharacterized membrane protein (DUF4010 family)
MMRDTLLLAAARGTVSGAGETVAGVVLVIIGSILLAFRRPLLDLYRQMTGDNRAVGVLSAYIIPLGLAVAGAVMAFRGITG